MPQKQKYDLNRHRETPYPCWEVEARVKVACGVFVSDEIAIVCLQGKADYLEALLFVVQVIVFEHIFLQLQVVQVSSHLFPDNHKNMHTQSIGIK